MKMLLIDEAGQDEDLLSGQGECTRDALHHEIASRFLGNDLPANLRADKWSEESRTFR